MDDVADTAVATTVEPLLAEARAAYTGRDWLTARRAFEAAADGRASGAGLTPDDEYAWANCSWWLGDLDQALPTLERAYGSFLAAGREAPAALVALDIGYTFMLRGDQARGSGWMRRATRLLDALPEGAEHGYLRHIDFETAFVEHDLARALSAADEVAELGSRYADPTLVALGQMGQGRVLVANGDVAAGLALLDEAMLEAASDRLDPGWAGKIYCHLMLACHEIGDLQRAGEWTQVTLRWCESMPGAGPFLGICRVHRAHVLNVHGAWDEAERHLDDIRDRHVTFPVDMVAEAHYLLAEIRRCRGDLTGAESSYQEAHRLGRDPQPGAALLALARGDVAAAATSVRTALAGARDPLTRAHLIPAAVEILVVAGDLDPARGLADELRRTADRYGTTGLTAEALTATGRVHLAAGDHEEALATLTAAAAAWSRLDAPLMRALVHDLLGRTYQGLGDADAAARTRRAAESERQHVLGAAHSDHAPDGRSAQAGGSRHRSRLEGLPGVTERETEVLDLVAGGLSNQEVAEALVLSVRTVERHLTSVYAKLDLHGPAARAGAVARLLGARAGTPPDVR